MSTIFSGNIDLLSICILLYCLDNLSIIEYKGVIYLLGNKLKQLREAKGLTRKAVAQYLNIDQTTYGKYELGKRDPDYDSLKMLADFFDVSIDYILSREEAKKPQLEKQLITDAMIDKVQLTDKDLKDIRRKAEGIKGAMMNVVGIAFDGKPEDEETLEAVLAALEEGLTLAKKEAKLKYTPKKFR